MLSSHGIAVLLTPSLPLLSTHYYYVHGWTMFLDNNIIMFQPSSGPSTGWRHSTGAVQEHVKPECPPAVSLNNSALPSLPPLPSLLYWEVGLRVVCFLPQSWCLVQAVTRESLDLSENPDRP